MFKYKTCPPGVMALILTLSLAGCSDSKDFEDKPSADSSIALMVGSEMEVFKGDVVQDPSGDAKIRVRHEAPSNRKFVTLLSGTANLVRSSNQGG